jgi:hypothetical protein
VPTLQADLTVAPGAGNATLFYNLSDSQRLDFELNQLKLYNGIVLTKDGIKKRTQPLLVHSCWNLSDFVIPNRVFQYQTTLSYYKLTQELPLTSSTSITANFGIPGLKLKSEYSDSKEKLSSLEEISSFVSASYDIPKVLLSLKTEDVNGNRIFYGLPFFENKIRNAFNEPGVKTQCKKLLTSLKETGFFIRIRKKVLSALFFVCFKCFKYLAKMVHT